MCNEVALCDSGDQYALAKLGSMQINKNSADSLFLVGGIYGVGVTPSLTLEGEANIAIGGGHFDSAGEKGQFDIWTIGGFLAYRYVVNASLYLKAKGGMIYESVGLSSDKRVEEDRSRGTGSSGGFGVGLVIPVKQRPVMLEFEITATDEDLVYYSFAMTSPF
jgi:hypothetical protein